MIKIFVSDPLSEEGLKILKDRKEFQVDVKTDLKPDALKESIKDYDGLVVRSATKVTRDILSQAVKLKVIGRAGVGLDNVDLEAATQKGIIVMNTPAGNTISTAEHTMSMILALSRNIPQAVVSTKKGEWKRSKFMGVELYGKILGIMGLGRIGSEVARRALSFGMKVLAFDPFLSREVAQGIGVELVELKEVLENADYITVHTPLTEETKHMLSTKEFAMMKKGVRVVNCARGGIIDELALVEAIKEGKVAGAALDVFEKEPLAADNPLLQVDNVIITPHLGASTEEAQVNVAVEVAQIVADALLGRGIRNAANYPCLEPEVCKIIEPYIKLTAFPRVMGVDGVNKMSKSLNNHIELAASPEEIQERVMTMVTDPQRKYRTDPGRPEVCNVYAFHGFFSPEEVEEINTQCRSADIGCVDCKRALARNLAARLAPFQARRAEFASDPALVWDILKDGASRATVIAQETMAEVRAKVGLP